VIPSGLLRRDFGTFNQLADKYGVTNVLLGPDEAAQLDPGGPVPTEQREMMSRAGGYVVFVRQKSRRP
jgi:hypothetical protein